MIAVGLTSAGVWECTPWLHLGPALHQLLQPLSGTWRGRPRPSQHPDAVDLSPSAMSEPLLREFVPSFILIVSGTPGGQSAPEETAAQWRRLALPPLHTTTFSLVPWPLHFGPGYPSLFLLQISLLESLFFRLTNFEVSGVDSWEHRTMASLCSWKSRDRQRDTL